MQRRRSASFLAQFRRTVVRHGLLVPGDRVLVALSGGPDSVVLLAALVKLAPAYDLTLCAAHLNHQLRGDESQRDQQFAESVARQLGVPCVVGTSADLAGSPNLEARARTQRYTFLAQVAAAQGCTKIATGHTLDDQAETVVMRLLRGTGWDGLAGIHTRRDGHIIRPMLECTREQVLDFLAECALPFCHDSSNDDRRFLRNRIRHEVMPLLRSINPRVAQALASAAEIVVAEGALLEERAAALLASTAQPDGSLAVSAVLQSPPALRARLVRRWLRQQRDILRSLTAAHIGAIVDVALGTRPNARVVLPAQLSVVREYKWLRLSAGRAAASVDAGCVVVPGSTISLASGWRISAELERQVGSWERPDDLWQLMADAAAIGAPLIVRSARPGDRVRPYGMRGHRKLQDIFVDRKLPRAARWTAPVLECGGEILWVPGVVRSDKALITPQTHAAWRLSVQKTAIAAT